MSSVEPPLSPLIAAQVDHLLQDPALPIKVDRIWSSSSDARYSDRFTLSIPFCLDYVQWDVIYNETFPTVAPDFVFAPEDRDFDPLSVISDGEVAKKSSLCDWSTKDHTRLLALVQEIRELYLQYHLKRVEELNDARLKFEIGTIVQREGIEVCVISASNMVEEAKFVVPLLVDMDINTAVQACPWRHHQRIYLQVIFPVSRSFFAVPSAPQIKLVSTPELKDLFSVEDVILRPWLDGMCLIEYLPAVEGSVKMQVMEATSSIGARRQFIEALTPFFGEPVEADPVFCRRATILSQSCGFQVLVHFLFPSQFPKQRPILNLQSLQHFDSQDTPISSHPINDYPWNPRWHPLVMARRMFEYLVAECMTFKTFCLDSCR